MTTTIDPEKFAQLKAAGCLPSPKGDALAIIRLTQRDGLGLADLADAMGHVPALAEKLLKAANAVSMSANPPVASLPEALGVLGIPAVRDLVLGFSLIAECRSGHCRNFDYGRFWSHALIRGIAFQALVQRLRAAAPEECFAVGMLSRIGELALATLFPEGYSKVLEKAGGAGIETLLRQEQDVFAMSHRDLTVTMLQDWGFPCVLVDAVFDHENPGNAGLVEGSRSYVLAWALVLAQRVADLFLANEAERRRLMPSLYLIGSHLSIDADAMSPLCNRIAREWVEWGSLLDVRAVVLPAFAVSSEVANGADPGCAPSAEGMRVLVVDDDPGFRAMLKRLLTDYGYEVYLAADGRQAFEMALERQPQIMLVDWMMPGMTGPELTRALRQTKIGRRIYVIVLTGLDHDDRLVEAFESGVDDFIAKPLQDRVLAARLRAGQRVVRLQDEVERDREEIRRFAAELAVTNRRLQEAALTDALTGFPNRRFAMERLEQEWSAAMRSKRPLACMVIDLDEFKPINDRYGHDIGDTVLRQAAQALKRGLRSQDVVARIGGDEFLVICPDTALPAAMACAERVRVSVESMDLPRREPQLRSTVSIGVAVIDEAMANVDALVKCADQGLYLAKAGGRNRIGASQQPA